MTLSFPITKQFKESRCDFTEKFHRKWCINLKISVVDKTCSSGKQNTEFVVQKESALKDILNLKGAINVQDNSCVFL